MFIYSQVVSLYGLISIGMKFACRAGVVQTHKHFGNATLYFAGMAFGGSLLLSSISLFFESGICIFVLPSLSIQIPALFF